MANPSAIQQYNGLKYADDRHDAFWLARLLSLGILPEGYIYPKEDRPISDLLRKRSFLVRQRVAHMNSLMSMIERNTGNRPSANAIRKLKPEDMDRIFDEEHLALIARTSVNALMALLADIRNIEKVVRKAVKTRKSFEYLHTVPGIADILALTIILEVGEISRFPNVGSFSSYCRCVPSRRISNGKSKGKGNTKNGNKYLSWAFVEAANIARRCSPTINRYYQKKSAKTNSIVAIKALSNKLARACYYIIRDGVPFKEEMLFG